MSSLRAGFVGAGGFARFVADAMAGLPGIRPYAVTDLLASAADELASAHGLRVADGLDALLADPEVEVVIVTTPPSTHAPITLAALAAGQHVFCEKPLATTVPDARSVTRAAARTGRVVVVDHVLRHNPLLHAVVRLRDEVLGPVQRLLYENDASDEHLNEHHWFWDEATSGGIFIEHAVHAFDAAHWLLGSTPTRVQATAVRRAPGTGRDVVDLVSATFTHSGDGGGVLATHTHSFSHADRCERQLLRLDHGTAQTRVHGWIPVDADVDLWTDDRGVEAVLRLVEDVPALMTPRPHGTLEVGGPVQPTVSAHVERDAGSSYARARGRDLAVPHHVRIELSLGGPSATDAVYASAVRAGLADLVRCARTGEAPVVGTTTASAAVLAAAGATRAARTGHAVSLALPVPPPPAPVPSLTKDLK